MFEFYYFNLFFSSVILYEIPGLLHPVIAFILCLVIDDFRYLIYFFALMLYLHYILAQLPMIAIHILGIANLDLFKIVYICLLVITYDNIGIFIPQFDFNFITIILSFVIAIFLSIYCLLIACNKCMGQLSLFFALQPFITLFMLFVLNYLVIKTPLIILQNLMI